MVEKTFAKQLQVLRDLHSATSGMGEYKPAQNAIKIQSLAEKITRIEQLNKDITNLEETLAEKRKARQVLVFGKVEKDGQDGIIRLTRQIAEYVDGLGEEYEARLEKIKALLKKMSPSGTRRKPLSADDRTRSISEQSYSSAEKNARDVYSAIEDIEDYSPKDPRIDKDNFLDKVKALKALNDEISDITNKQLSELIKRRQNEYSSRTTGVSRILTEVKRYVRGCYGKNSDEYNRVRLIKL